MPSISAVLGVFLQTECLTIHTVNMNSLFSPVTWTTTIQCCTASQTTYSSECSQCRMLPQEWLCRLVDENTSHLFCENYSGCLFTAVWTSSWQHLCSTHCMVARCHTCQMFPSRCMTSVIIFAHLVPSAPQHWDGCSESVQWSPHGGWEWTCFCHVPARPDCCIRHRRSWPTSLFGAALRFTGCHTALVQVLPEWQILLHLVCRCHLKDCARHLLGSPGFSPRPSTVYHVLCGPGRQGCRA